MADKGDWKKRERDVEEDYKFLTGNNWTIDELLKLREEDPEAFSLLMDEYFWSNLRVPGRSPEVEKKFFKDKEWLEYYGSPPGTMMKLPGYDHDPAEGYPRDEATVQGVADDWYNSVYDRLRQKQTQEFVGDVHKFEEYRRKEREGVDNLFDDIEAEDKLGGLLSFLAEKGAKGSRLLGGAGMALYPSSTALDEDEDIALMRQIQNELRRRKR